ncbi:MAG TPA: riboflavin synthase [Cytophagaceae bacterium]|jgi:riboflavin synthase|nr:riboflavin synthase [Cytophagaceae bacterium]
MFTGIIEAMGKVVSIQKDKSNIHFGIEAPFVQELKIDQSIAHDGVCLTVTAIEGTTYFVTAIDETLQKTNLTSWKVGNFVNLERCMLLGGRLDGHIVQGHVDQTSTCISILENNGSWIFTFQYDDSKGNVTIEKGSITINGISLTVINSEKNNFSVAIIPYTYEHTNLHFLQKSNQVNLEFDIIGKYVARLIEKRGI